MSAHTCTTFTYGEYELKPAPLFNASTTLLKTPDGSGYGVIYNIDFNGTILLTGVEERESGIKGVFTEIEAFQKAFNREGRLLLVRHSGAGDTDYTAIFSGYPRIDSYSINQRGGDNFVFAADYDFSLNLTTWRGGFGDDYVDPFNNNTGTEREFPQYPPYIESMNESWDIEMDQDRVPSVWRHVDEFGNESGAEVQPFYATVNHTVDVQARLIFTGWDSSNDETVHTDPWDDAKSWVSGYLYSNDGLATRAYDQKKYGFVTGLLQLNKVYNLSGQGYKNMIRNHYRSVSSNITEGTIQVKETYLIAPQPSSGDLQSNDAREDWTATMNFSNGLYTFNVNGEIKGLETNNYANLEKPGFQWSIADSRFARAEEYWNLVEPRLRTRAMVAREKINSGEGACAFNVPKIPSTPTQQTVGFNPAAGTISYDYSYELFPKTLDCGDDFCILSQQIRVDDTNANDVFASHVILGRRQGPILQDLGTVTAKQRSVSVEIRVPPPTSIATTGYMYQTFPTGCVNDLVAQLTGNLSPAPDQVFVTQNTESLGITDGTYTKQVAVIYTQCAPPA